MSTKHPHGPAYLPGDPVPAEQVARIVRVDQAGEFGAVRIYAGQRAVLRRGPAADAVKEMAEQEREHLETFDRLIAERRVRPTALGPLWNVAGYALGATTALLGEKAAMACTVAVEDVIDEHYANQLETLGDDEPELRKVITEFREDELEHHDTALKHGAEDAPGYPLLSATVKASSRLAIWLSERF
ncbi:MAG: demethoxyubiquinone hydroxylase family protein [Alphaproteobacteria bacterium]|nr:demethoxyubiquinone hydroxylase family protein [Alphaproteobacteria bacterium]